MTIEAIIGIITGIATVSAMLILIFMIRRKTLGSIIGGTNQQEQTGTARWLRVVVKDGDKPAIVWYMVGDDPPASGFYIVRGNIGGLHDIRAFWSQEDRHWYKYGPYGPSKIYPTAWRNDPSLNPIHTVKLGKKPWIKGDMP